MVLAGLFPLALVLVTVFYLKGELTDLRQSPF
jgi:hypothetical protein